MFSFFYHLFEDYSLTKLLYYPFNSYQLNVSSTVVVLTGTARRRAILAWTSRVHARVFSFRFESVRFPHDLRKEHGELRFRVDTALWSRLAYQIVVLFGRGRTVTTTSHFETQRISKSLNPVCSTNTSIGELRHCDESTSTRGHRRAINCSSC